MEDEGVIPGLFKLDLPVNDKNIGQEIVQRKLRGKEQDLKSRSDRPEELAILNLLGLLKFALKQYNESLDHFSTVLEKDSDNLNAMANKQHVLLELTRKKEARCFQDKLEGFVGQATTQERIIKAQARCLAEQAYVYAADMHTDGNCCKRYEQSNEIFRKALNNAGQIVDTSEKDFWEFVVAKNVHKLLNKLRYKDNYAQGNSYTNTVASLFFKIANRDPGDSEYRWESWQHLGDLAGKIKRENLFDYAQLQPLVLRECIRNPEKCMKRAMDISPDNPRLLARYANCVFSLKRESCFSEVLELLDKSVSLDDSDSNYYAFSTRGMIYMKSYQGRMRKYNKDHGQFPPHPDMLEKAKADLEKAVELRNKAWDLVHLAKVYHHLARSDTVVTHEKRQYLELELETLKRCEDCADHGDRQQKLHQTFGRCFFDLGEYRESIDRFKRAMHLQSPGSLYTGYFREIMCSYLSLLRSEYKHQHAQPLLGEMVQVMRKAIGKYGSDLLTRSCSPVLQKEYEHEVLVLCDYCDNIPDTVGIVHLLKSAEPSPPFTPVGPGGTLKDIWEQPIPQPTLENIRRESQAGSTGSFGRAADSGLDTWEEGECIQPLVSGDKDLEVSHSLGQVPPDNRSNVKSVASATDLVKGLYTQNEGEGRLPLVSEFKGSEPPGNKNDVKLAESATALVSGSDSQKESEGKRQLVSGVESLEVTNSSGQEPPGNTNDERLVASATALLEGSDSQEEGEDIRPQVRELKDLEAANSSGQELPGNMNDVRLVAAMVLGSDSQEGQGIELLVSGIKGRELRGLSDENVQESEAQSWPAFESQSGAFSPEKEHKFLFDFYVVHSDRDQDWVENKLLYELETVRGLKGRTFMRDACLGSFVFHGKVEPMKQCACILFLHGKDFTDGQYLAQHSLKCAKEPGCVVIPIEREGSPIPEELSVMKSFDASVGRANWDRLAKTITSTKGAPSYSGTLKALGR